ncbi:MULTISPECIES: MFS transporter [unclassified Streptomyces]|uniref:MFS transporter n=1 Tax=unclassified Streptomyces TaxID=2593676 RepID=UPI0001C1BDAF|nr:MULTISPECIES: MFS transporter [unclassified Streptomyces]AEN08686.1 major facilitator superfamily MFS_1 [Streptomyces sp. SirexAA-E]MYR64938.1 MFS transporter [Streptomyces sp. SID4939]MYS04082.1 MFS transporter [Streptomyces sp. SID4940]MYT65560.1 MFS transporter [Streptomyces sp. SID8357]MYT89029.1 MFS transporter [Streptomyces sp. SID8360]
MDSATRRWRAALFLFMLAAGTGMASWVARTPAVRDGLDVSTGAMGLVLFGLSTGSMAGVTASGPLVRRYGGRVTISAGATLVVAGLLVVAAGASLSLAAGVFGGLALFGGGMGLAEVAFNIEGAAVESVIGRPVLPVLHGCFSLGTVVGALLGMALTAVEFPVGWHLTAVAALIAAAAVRSVLSLPQGTGKEAPFGGSPQQGGTQGRSRVWRDRRLLLIGVIVLAMAFAEGAANDWLPLLMVDGYHVSATAGSLTFLAFASSMALGRFAGGPLLERYGRVQVVRVSAVTAALGLVVVIVSPSPLMAGAATILWGLGASLGFPVTLSAAGDHPHDAAARVGAVATTGYVAFLVGPPALGFLADRVGLRLTMTVVLALLVVASTLAGVLAPGRRADAEAEPASA